MEPPAAVELLRRYMGWGAWGHGAVKMSVFQVCNIYAQSTNLLQWVCQMINQ